MREPRLDQAPLPFVGHELLDRARSFSRARRLLLLDDPGARADHLRQRPVGDALAVRKAAALVPADELLDAIGVLEELPQQPRLADAGVTDDGHQPRVTLRCALLERLDHAGQLALAADERRLEPDAPPRAAGARDDPQRGPRADRLLAALDLVLAGILVRDRGLACPARDVVDQHRPRRAIDCRRDAVLTVSPSTIPSPSAPSSTAALPVSTPARTCSSGIPASSPSSATVARQRQRGAARTARRRPRARPAFPKPPSPRRR